MPANPGTHALLGRDPKQQAWPVDELARPLHSGRRMKTIGLTLALLLWSGAASATTRICVGVQQKSWYKPAPAPPAPRQPAAPAGDDDHADSTTPAGPPAAAAPQPAPAPQQELPKIYQPPAPPRANPHQIDPTLYLKRMLEYEVTHEPGFAAVSEGCAQRLTVELYQLENGWTVFARYSGSEREEKIDHADVDEFVELAQRIAFSLLRSKPITQTITRENVLRADSETNLRTIDGTGHFTFGMGTEARVGKLPTAQGQDQPVADELRVLTPVSIQLGYRRKLRSWGLDAFTRLALGTESTGVRHNDLGGHIDYLTSVSTGLHFLHYLDAPGVTSFYFGGGAEFELAFFQAIRPLKARTASERELLTSGGLNLDLLVGYEFLRASSVHFYGQVDLEVPTYLVKSENDSGSINAYMPGVVAQIGIIF
jgi:hypothetical protein